MSKSLMQNEPFTGWLLEGGFKFRLCQVFLFVRHAAGDFVQGPPRPLPLQVPKLEDRISLWQVLRKNEAVSCISDGIYGKLNTN